MKLSMMPCGKIKPITLENNRSSMFTFGTRFSGSAEPTELDPYPHRRPVLARFNATSKLPDLKSFAFKEKSLESRTIWGQPK